MDDIEHRSVSSMTSMMIKFEKLNLDQLAYSDSFGMLSMIGSSTKSAKTSKRNFSGENTPNHSSRLPLLPFGGTFLSSSSNKRNNRISVVDAVVDSASALGETVKFSYLWLSMNGKG